MEYISKEYKGVIRYKEVEFDRNWNISNIIGNKTLLNHQLFLLADENNFLEYQYQNLRIGDTYYGVKNIGKIKYEQIKNRIKYKCGFLGHTSRKLQVFTYCFIIRSLVKKWKYLDFDLTLNSERQNNFDEIENFTRKIVFHLLNFPLK